MGDNVAVPDEAFLADCQNFSKLTIQDTIANIEGRLNTNSSGLEDADNDMYEEDEDDDDIIPQAANEMGSGNLTTCDKPNDLLMGVGWQIKQI